MASTDYDVWQGPVSFAEDMVLVALSGLALTEEQAKALKYEVEESKAGLPDTIIDCLEGSDTSLGVLINKLADTVPEAYKFWLGVDEVGVPEAKIQELLPAIRAIALRALEYATAREEDIATHEEWWAYYNSKQT